MITGDYLPIKTTMIQFLARKKLPNNKTVNCYRCRQLHSANEWNFYYYKGKKFYISEQDYCNSTGV
jgi:hypothetical protein